MKKLLISLLCVVMMVTFMPSMAFATGGNSLEPSQETVVSITVDGETTDYTTWKEALDRTLSGTNIVVKLNQDVNFTEEGVYSKNSQTSGIYLYISSSNADVTLDLNGHNVTNHFKNPNGDFPARGFSLSMKGGNFKVVNNANTTSTFDVERLGQVKSRVSSSPIEFTFGENINTNTKDLELKYIISKYSDFYIGFNGGFKGLQADGSYNFYTSASEAIKNSTDNTAILVNDYNGSDGFSASNGTNGTVNLNNKTFTTSSTAFNLQNSDVDLTIKNGVVNAYSDIANADNPNVGFLGSAAHDVNEIELTLDHVTVNSNYQRGIDFHGTDTDLHLDLIESELNMENETSYGIYMPAKESTVKIEKSTIKAGTGIAVKGGTLDIIDSKIQSVGEAYEPSEGTPSGFEETGDAIYVDGFYKNDIKVNIKNSEVTSKNAKAVNDLFVEETNDTEVVAESGTFSSSVLKYVPAEKASAKVDANYHVGSVDEIKEAAKNATASVVIQKGIDEIEIPSGVEVTNQTGKEITVNGHPVTNNTTVIPSKVSIDNLQTSYVEGDVAEFKVSTKPASYDENESVKGYITGLTDEEKALVKVWYKEIQDGKWYELKTDYFGPENGFPFVEASSEFKIEFINEGQIDFGVEIRNLDGVVLASAEKTIEVTAKETPDYPYIPPTNPVQKPVIEAEDGATVTLSKDGTTATIVVDENATLKDVLLNGKSLGAVTEVKNLKTGDKLVVVVETLAEKNARLKAGVENTSIRMYYKKGEIGKGWIKLRFKKEFGFKVDNYEIFRSPKKKTNFGKKAWFVTKTNKTTGYYKNGKSVKKGTRYYYKMRGVREIAGETVYTQWSNIVMRTGR